MKNIIQTAIGSFIGIVISLSIWVAVGGSITQPDNQMHIGKYIQTEVNIPLDSHDKNRLDALDGGKEKEWSCLIDYTHLCHSWELDSCEPQYRGHKVVIRTLGAEIPKQLGYDTCKEIPQSQWDITKEPINK